jgi:hypothetical protein
MAINAIRRIAAAVPVVALLSVPSIAVATPAAAAPYPPGGGALFLSSNRPIAGRPLVFVGTGFTARETVAARLDSRLLRTTRADFRGTARGSVIIPRSTTSGWHTFSLRGTRSGRVLSATVVVRRLFGRAAADTTSADINTAPVASQVTPRENGPSSTTLAAGSAAALAAFGGGSYVLHRRRRSHNPLNR